MSIFSDKLRLKEMVEEDIYFAKRDQELIRALHEENLAEQLKDDDKEKVEQAKELQKKYAQVTRKHRLDTRELAEHYRKLVEKALKLIQG